MKSSLRNEETVINQTFIMDKPFIILVDDNELINNSNKKLLSDFIKENNLNYNIILGTDGLDIIKLVLKYENKYNLIKFIITDENMDYYNGTEAIAFIRKFEKVKKLKNTIILTLTCHEDVHMINYIKKLGADNVLSKPLSKQLLKLYLIEH